MGAFGGLLPYGSLVGWRHRAPYLVLMLICSHLDVSQLYFVSFVFFDLFAVWMYFGSAGCCISVVLCSFLARCV